MPFFKRLFHLVYSGIKKILHAIGKVQSFLILSVIYLIFFGATSLLAKILRTDLLAKRIGPEPTFWLPKPEEKIDLARAQQPF